MTQEQKDLLLKDLCARLPHGVVIQEKCVEQDKTFLPNKEEDRLVNIDTHANLLMTNCGSWYHLEEVKPYLFPLSSMTEEIEDEIYMETGLYNIFINGRMRIYDGTNFLDVCKLFNILNKYHLDYNGLIDEELANDATGLDIY